MPQNYSLGEVKVYKFLELLNFEVELVPAINTRYEKLLS